MGTGAISWSSCLQSIVALSTMEAEFVAAVSAGQEVLWLRNLLTEFGFDVSAASRLRIDNLSALSVAKNPEHHGRMKHLDLRFYWLRDEVAKGRIEVEHLRTSDMPADILTKSLAKPKVLESLPEFLCPYQVQIYSPRRLPCVLTPSFTISRSLLPFTVH